MIVTDLWRTYFAVDMKFNLVAFLLRLCQFKVNIFLANVNSSSRSLYVIDGPSVCLSSVVCRLSVCLSVTFVRPTQTIEIFGNVSTL